uniref:N-methystylopine hydroxylase n=1 Tax=Eschscholzia californica subsp. californica TaxID=222997 RepID=A0A2Z6BXW6_ESCCA|nr:N-methystylopine hydroxylase [Eschscholzia californica subsp. californica]
MEFHFPLMEQFQSFSIFALLLASFIFLYKLFNFGKRNTKNGKPTAPEASGGRLIMGHLHLFNGTELTHRTLGSMADKYGPAFNIRFGSHKTLVVSSWKIIKECFTTNDRFFSNRPGSLAIKLMFYDADSVGYAPYGSYWRELRKISTLKLLSNHRLETLKHLRTSEVDSCFNQLMNSWAENKNRGDSDFAPVRMDDWFGDLTFNVVARIVAGKKNFAGGAARGDAGAQRYKSAMDEAFRLMTIFAYSDVIPSLGWLDKLRGLVGDMKRCGSEIDSVVESWVDEHRLKRRVSNKGGELDLEQDFIDVCLDIMEHSSLPGDDPEIVIKSTCLDMILGGSDTTTVTLTWALSLLLNHPQVLKRAKEELDSQVGKERQVEDSDIPNLPLIQAIIKETMRLYPAGPLIERRTMEDCEVAGFHVPAGTRLLVNLWKMQRDKEVWSEEPLEFRPERFLTSNTEVDLKGQHYELIPFGAGRRICPGVSFAVQLMHLVLARLLHGFEMTTPMGEKVDMTESAGLISHKITPLEVLIKPLRV